MSNSMRIKSVGEVKVATDGRKYFGIELSAGLGQRSASRQMWQQFKRDPKTGLPTAEKYWERGSQEEFKASIGKEIEARKVTHKVTPYLIAGSDEPRSTYSSILFPDENEVTLFASAGHNIITEDGEVLGNERAVLAKAGEASAKVTVVA